MRWMGWLHTKFGVQRSIVLATCVVGSRLPRIHSAMLQKGSPIPFRLNGCIVHERFEKREYENEMESSQAGFKEPRTSCSWGESNL